MAKFTSTPTPLKKKTVTKMKTKTKTKKIPNPMDPTGKQTIEIEVEDSKPKTKETKTPSSPPSLKKKGGKEDPETEVRKVKRIMPRKAYSQDSKTRFKEMANTRVSAALTALESIEKMARNKEVEYTKEQADKILDTLRAGLSSVAEAFKNPEVPVKKKFSID